MSERSYLNLMRDVLLFGEHRDDRTGVGTRSLFGQQLKFKLGYGFPLLTTKRLHTKSIIHELLWIIRGDTNIRPLQEAGVTIWDEWAGGSGELGPVYGHQWRRFGVDWDNRGVDQLKNVVTSIQEDPFSRRHVVTAWNPMDVGECELPPCHVLFQFYVHRDLTLSCHMYQRSADIFLGVPFNIASYALLTMMVAEVTGYRPGELIISYGDVHLYNNHVAPAREQLTRNPRPMPSMVLAERESLFDFVYEDFTLEKYEPYPAIKAEVAV